MADGKACTDIDECKVDIHLRSSVDVFWTMIHFRNLDMTLDSAFLFFFLLIPFQLNRFNSMNCSITSDSTFDLAFLFLFKLIFQSIG